MLLNKRVGYDGKNEYDEDDREAQDKRDDETKSAQLDSFCNGWPSFVHKPGNKNANNSEEQTKKEVPRLCLACQYAYTTVAAHYCLSLLSVEGLFCARLICLTRLVIRSVCPLVLSYLPLASLNSQISQL